MTGAFEPLGRRSEVLMRFVRDASLESLQRRGWQNQKERDDFWQIALLSIWNTLQSYDDHDDMALGAIATKRARWDLIDYWKSRFGPRRRKRIEDKAGSLDQYRTKGGEAVAANTDANFVERLSLWDELEARLGVLPERWARILRPFFYEGRSVEECADEAGITSTRLRQIIRASRLPVRNSLRRSAV